MNEAGITEWVRDRLPGQPFGSRTSGPMFAEVVADLSTGVTNSEPSWRIDSYHSNETWEVRPLVGALRFDVVSG